MPRLKLPSPAKRKALMEAVAQRTDDYGFQSRVALVRKGYAMALRHVHVIRNKEERVRRRRAWAHGGFYRDSLAALRTQITELERQLAEFRQPGLIKAGGTD